MEVKRRGSSRPVEIGERGSYFISGERIDTPAGPRIYGQSFVQYEFPVNVTHPYPVVFVHGGGGQGLDFVSTPDGREGWAGDFLRAGYKVYVIDRQGHGRARQDGGEGGPMLPLDMVVDLFVGRRASPMTPFAELHTQWPGSGEPNDPVVLNFLASQGAMMADVAEAHRLMRRTAIDLLEEIGPSILVTNSAGGAWGWQAADAVPHLVKGIVCVEGAFTWSMPMGPPKAEAELFAFTAAPMAFDPPVGKLDEFRLEMAQPTEAGARPYPRQVDPPRRLKNFSGIPVGYVTGEASFLRPATEGVLANMRQLEVDVDDLSLWKHGINGNGHVPMCELNSSEVAAFLMDWLLRRVEAPAAAK